MEETLVGEENTPHCKLIDKSSRSNAEFGSVDVREADEEIHLYVDLEEKDGTTTRARVDECVLESFVGPRPDPKMVPIHLDGDYKNCALTNLKWGYTTTTN
jgi:hypothetical protein